MTNYLFPLFVGICLLYICIFVIPKMIREHKVQIAKEIFMEETPIKAVCDTGNTSESYNLTIDDFDLLQDWLYNQAQLGKACTIKIVLEENAGSHKGIGL